MKTNRCVIIGASPDSKTDDLKRLITSDDFVICADGGYLKAKQADITPRLLIGDFDSSMYPCDCECDIVQLPVQKDDTDTILAIRWAMERGYRRFELYGVLGGRRLDMTVASLQTLQFLRLHGAQGMLVGDGWNVTLLEHGALRFPASAAGTLSVFCAGAPCSGVTLRNLKYTLEDGAITGGYPFGVSNAFIGEPAEIAVKKGMLYVLWQDDVRPEEVPI